MNARIAGLLLLSAALGGAASGKKKKDQKPPEPSPLDKYISDAYQDGSFAASGASARLHLVAECAFFESGVRSQSQPRRRLSNHRRK